MKLMGSFLSVFLPAFGRVVRCVHEGVMTRQQVVMLFLLIKAEQLRRPLL